MNPDLNRRDFLRTTAAAAGAASFAPLAAARDLPLKSEPVVVGQARTVNSDFQILSAPLDGTVVWGPVTLRDPTGQPRDVRGAGGRPDHC